MVLQRFKQRLQRWWRGDRNPAELAVGQVWRYRNRPQEPDSTLTILRIDEEPKWGRIVHITVHQLQVQSPDRAAGVTPSFPHIAIDEANLRRSITELVGRGAPDPKFVSRYLGWRMFFERGEPVVFSMPVADIAAKVEKYNQEEPVKAGRAG